MCKPRFCSGFISLVAVATLFAGASAFAETVSFKAELSGANEVPAVEGSGKGTVSASYDSVSKVLTYTVEYSDLSGPATAAHFHGPADTSHNAPVMIPVSTGYASPMKGAETLTDAQAADLMAAQLYFNIHTAKNKPGEIRGQIVKAK
jgi:hypothetical protein